MSAQAAPEPLNSSVLLFLFSSQALAVNFPTVLFLWQKEKMQFSLRAATAREIDKVIAQ